MHSSHRPCCLYSFLELKETLFEELWTQLLEAQVRIKPVKIKRPKRHMAMWFALVMMMIFKIQEYKVICVILRS